MENVVRSSEGFKRSLVIGKDIQTMMEKFHTNLPKRVYIHALALAWNRYYWVTGQGNIEELNVNQLAKRSEIYKLIITILSETSYMKKLINVTHELTNLKVQIKNNSHNSSNNSKRIQNMLDETDSDDDDIFQSIKTSETVTKTVFDEENDLPIHGDDILIPNEDVPQTRFENSKNRFLKDIDSIYEDMHTFLLSFVVKDLCLNFPNSSDLKSILQTYPQYVLKVTKQKVYSSKNVDFDETNYDTDDDEDYYSDGEDPEDKSDDEELSINTISIKFSKIFIDNYRVICRDVVDMIKETRGCNEFMHNYVSKYPLNTIVGYVYTTGPNFLQDVVLSELSIAIYNNLIENPTERTIMTRKNIQDDILFTILSIFFYFNRTINKWYIFSQEKDPNSEDIVSYWKHIENEDVGQYIYNFINKELIPHLNNTLCYKIRYSNSPDGSDFNVSQAKKLIETINTITIPMMKLSLNSYGTMCITNDINPNFITFKNTQLNLDTFETNIVDYFDYSLSNSKLSINSYDVEFVATIKLFKNFFKQRFEDIEVIKYYCYNFLKSLKASKDIRENFHEVSEPGCGKSATWKIYSKIFNDGVVGTLSDTSLMVKYESLNGAIAPMVENRIVYVADVKGTHKLDGSIFKLSSGDNLQINKKYQNVVSNEVIGTIWTSSNHPVQYIACESALIDRTVVFYLYNRYVTSQAFISKYISPIFSNPNQFIQSICAGHASLMLKLNKNYLTPSQLREILIGGYSGNKYKPIRTMIKGVTLPVENENDRRVNLDEDDIDLIMTSMKSLLTIRYGYIAWTIRTKSTKTKYCYAINEERFDMMNKYPSAIIPVILHYAKKYNTSNSIPKQLT